MLFENMSNKDALHLLTVTIYTDIDTLCFRTDYYWAKAMGYTGSQLADSAGVSVGTDQKPTFEYMYLGGRCRHYKLVGIYT